MKQSQAQAFGTSQHALTTEIISDDEFEAVEKLLAAAEQRDQPQPVAVSLPANQPTAASQPASQPTEAPPACTGHPAVHADASRSGATGQAALAAAGQGASQAPSRRRRLPASFLQPCGRAPMAQSWQAPGAQQDRPALQPPPGREPQQPAGGGAQPLRFAGRLHYATSAQQVEQLVGQLLQQQPKVRVLAAPWVNIPVCTRSLCCSGSYSRGAYWWQHSHPMHPAEASKRLCG